MSWALTILGIVALIVLHELGHFAVAKAVGMRVERFSLFFPPRLFGVRRGETDYAVGLLPLGGYVKITGMNPDEVEGLDPAVARRAYYTQPPWKRIAVILAGPGMNLLIAFVLFWGVLVVGDSNGVGTLANLNPQIATLSPTTLVASVAHGEPAAGVLRPGDRIVAVGARAAGPEGTRAAIDAHRCAGALTEGCRAQTPVQLTVRGAGGVRTVSLYPRYNREADRMLIGVEFALVPAHQGALAAAGVAAHEMWDTTTGLLANLGHAFTSQKAREQISSIVGITEATQQAVAHGAGFGLVILGFVSLALAVINLFPFLPLDGGHVLWAVAEKVRGRRVSLNAMLRFSSVGILLLAFLVINGFSNDISRLGG